MKYDRTVLIGGYITSEVIIEVGPGNEVELMVTATGLASRIIKIVSKEDKEKEINLAEINPE